MSGSKGIGRWKFPAFILSASIRTWKSAKFFITPLKAITIYTSAINTRTIAVYNQVCFIKILKRSSHFNGGIHELVSKFNAFQLGSAYFWGRSKKRGSAFGVC